MELLREQKRGMELLIMLEISIKTHSRQRDIAEALGVTPQDISYHVKSLKRKRWVERKGGAYSPTIKGVQHLHDSLTDLKKFIDNAFGKLRIISRCTAIAGRDIKQGQSVTLVMRGGLLYAIPSRRGGSLGKALSSAKRGKEIAVGELSGILELEPGQITLIEVPHLEEGGSRTVSTRKLQKELDKIDADVVGIYGVTSTVLANALKLEPALRFGLADGVIEASQKGLIVVVLIDTDAIERLVSQLKEKKSDIRLERIEQHLVLK